MSVFIERQERLSEEIDKLAARLGEAEEGIRRAGVEGKVGAIARSRTVV